MNPKSSATTVRNLFGGLRDELRERRQARVAYYDLKRDLAVYRTPSAVNDLLVAVDRDGNTPEAEQMRAILEHNLSDYRRRQQLAS